ncbi:hypothetical protein ACWDBD_25740 [Streptomyces sp. NPDC001118]
MGRHPSGAWWASACGDGPAGPTALGPGVLAVLPPAGVTLRVLTRAEIPAAVPLTAPRSSTARNSSTAEAPGERRRRWCGGQAGPGGLTAAL